MQTLSVIQREHRAIAAVIHCLEQLLREVRAGDLDPPPFDVFDLIVTYMRDFPDQLHHPKEDNYLFPVLAKRAPELGGAFDLLRRQHVEGAKRTHDLSAKLAVYRKDPKTGFAAFEEAALGFVEFQREHLAFEESRILPAARENLTATDWKAIDAAFAKNDDPIFGDKPQAKFNKLFSRIVATAPEPWGLKARNKQPA